MPSRALCRHARLRIASGAGVLAAGPGCCVFNPNPAVNPRQAPAQADLYARKFALLAEGRLAEALAAAFPGRGRGKAGADGDGGGGAAEDAAEPSLEQQKGARRPLPGPCDGASTLNMVGKPSQVPCNTSTDESEMGSCWLRCSWGQGSVRSAPGCVTAHKQRPSSRAALLVLACSALQVCA